MTTRKDNSYREMGHYLYTFDQWNSREGTFSFILQPNPAELPGINDDLKVIFLESRKFKDLAIKECLRSDKTDAKIKIEEGKVIIHSDLKHNSEPVTFFIVFEQSIEFGSDKDIRITLITKENNQVTNFDKSLQEDKGLSYYFTVPYSLYFPNRAVLTKNQAENPLTINHIHIEKMKRINKRLTMKGYIIVTLLYETLDTIGNLFIDSVIKKIPFKHELNLNEIDPNNLVVEPLEGETKYSFQNLKKYPIKEFENFLSARKLKGTMKFRITVNQ